MKRTSVIFHTSYKWHTWPPSAADTDLIPMSVFSLTHFSVWSSLEGDQKVATVPRVENVAYNWEFSEVNLSILTIFIFTRPHFMALDFTPNKMRNCGRIWSTAVWSLTAEGVSLESVLRDVGSMAQRQWRGGYPQSEAATIRQERSQGAWTIKTDARGGEEGSNCVCLSEDSLVNWRRETGRTEQRGQTA